MLELNKKKGVVVNKGFHRQIFDKLHVVLDMFDNIHQEDDTGRFARQIDFVDVVEKEYIQILILGRQRLDDLINSGE